MPNPRFSERKGSVAQRGFEGPTSMISEHIHNIRSKALRCRELAGAASDAEVAEELLRIATELETALHVLRDPRSEDASTLLMD